MAMDVRLPSSRTLQPASTVPGTPSPASPGDRPPNDWPDPGRRRGRSGGPIIGVPPIPRGEAAARGRATFFARTPTAHLTGVGRKSMPRTPSAYRAALSAGTRPLARLPGLLALVLGVLVATVAISATAAYAAPHRASHHARHHHHHHHAGAHHHRHHAHRHHHSAF